MLRGLSLAVVLVAMTGTAYGQIEVGSDQSDGAFEPAGSMTIDLAQADTAPGFGRYDPDRWAVVFHYSSVNIPSGVTVNFANHPSGAPVVWLVAGDVTISGGLNLDGESDTGAAARPSIAGPGGFRGGRAYLSPQSPGSGGYGPGGGAYASTDAPGSAGSYGTQGSVGGPTYGNEQVIPLIGGSGGAAHGARINQGGGAGGGAILIAANGTIAVNGWIRANGGNANNGCCGNGSGGGSGGGIRLVATSATGGGQLLAQGSGAVRQGGKGRIRVEAETISLTHSGDPVYSFNPPDLAMRCVGGINDNSICADAGECDSGACLNDVPLLWPPSAAPQLVATKLVVNGVDVPIPADPRASLVFPEQDASIDAEDPVTLHIDALNVPLDWIVEVHAVAKSGGVLRVEADPLVGTPEASTTTASLTLPRGFSAVQLRAYNPSP